MDTERFFSFLEQEASPSVLATLISVNGHSYRKEGAAMLFARDGRRIGSISPGCLEADMQERVHRILETGEHEVVDYNLRPEEDAMWGEEIGCGGAIRILLEPAQGRLLKLLTEIGGRVRSGESIRLVRRMCCGRLRYSMEFVSCRDDRAAGGKIVYTSLFAPPERLILFGAGNEAVEISDLARKIGFRTAVADWRPELCSRERFPLAVTAIGDPESIVRQLAIESRDYVIIGSHHLRRDREMLERLLPLQPAYIGIIGSTRRIGLLFDGLPIPPFVKAPVGMPIGAKGAEEIAVSAAAELIAWRKQARAKAAAWS